MVAVSEFITSTIGVWTYCGILFLFTLYYVFVLYRDSEKIISNLKSANAKLKELDGESGFTANYEEFNDCSNKNELIGHAWGEFTETLIFPEENDKEKIIKTNDAAIMQSKKKNVRLICREQLQK